MSLEVAGYRLRAERLYDSETHLWVEPRPRTRARVGFDPLGAETCGDIVVLSFAERGSSVRRGEPFGDVEAAKFVGPLVAPVSGVVAAHNDALTDSPWLVNEEPFAHWLVELELADPGELGELLEGEERVAAWFEAEVERFRTKGAIAE